MTAHLTDRPVKPTGRRRVTLTFDNGPDLDGTPPLLDVLGREELQATFFFVGEKVAPPAGRRIAQRTKDEGHKIANHTMHHGAPLGLRSDQESVAEIADADEILAPLSSQPLLFRPNGGGALGRHLLSRGAVKYLLERGHTVVTWNNLPRDWEGAPSEWVARALTGVAERDHSVLVLHDVLPSTAAALGGLIKGLRDMGVEFTDTFPEDCVVISGGHRRRSLAGLVAAEHRP